MKILNATPRSKSKHINKVVGKFYPCYDDCEKIDLIIDDNGCKEYYTKEKELSIDVPNAIYVDKNEIRSSFENGHEFIDYNEFEF